MTLANAVEDVLGTQGVTSDTTTQDSSESDSSSSGSGSGSTTTTGGLPPYFDYKDINRNSLILLVFSLIGLTWFLSDKVSRGVRP